MALDITWEDHIQNIDLFWDVPRISVTISKRRLRLAGNLELAVHYTILWEPTQGTGKRGQRRATFNDALWRQKLALGKRSMRTLILHTEE